MQKFTKNICLFEIQPEKECSELTHLEWNTFLMHNNQQSLELFSDY